MASPPRLYMKGCAQHVAQRSNNRSICFKPRRILCFFCKFKDAKKSISEKLVESLAINLENDTSDYLVVGGELSPYLNVQRSLYNSKAIAFVTDDYLKAGV